MAFQRAGAYVDQTSGPWFDRFADTDWREELRLISTAVLMVVPMSVPLIPLLFDVYLQHSDRSSDSYSAFISGELNNL